MCIITQTAALADSAETMEILKKWKYWDAPEQTYSPCFTPFRSEAAAISKPPHFNTVLNFELLMYSCVVSKHITDRCICLSRNSWIIISYLCSNCLELVCPQQETDFGNNSVIIHLGTLCMDYLYTRQTVRNPYMIYLLFISSC